MAWSRSTARPGSPTASTWTTRSTRRPSRSTSTSTPTSSPPCERGPGREAHGPQLAWYQAASAGPRSHPDRGGLFPAAAAAVGGGQLPAVPVAPVRGDPRPRRAGGISAGHPDREGAPGRGERPGARRGQGAGQRRGPQPHLPAGASPGSGGAVHRLSNPTPAAHRALAAPEPAAQPAGDLLGLPALLAGGGAPGDPLRRLPLLRPAVRALHRVLSLPAGAGLRGPGGGGAGHLRRPQGGH